jgi:hypothetical protein
MIALQTVTVGSGGASSIAFTSIPQTYTDLRILLSGRSTGTNQTLLIQFNSDTTSTNYRRLALGAADTLVFSQNINDQGIGYIPISTYTANTFGNAEIYIPNYTSTTAKSYYTDSVAENNASEAYLGLFANTYTGTAAITSITLTAGGANFAQYSTATLYGVTSAATAAKATGGNFITTDGTYFYHTFTSSGTFTPTQSLTADTLVIAGGGGSGRTGGGGGAGGLRGLTSQSMTATAYTITVGAGGVGATSDGTNATNGNNSSIAGSGFSTITASGGGGGASFNNVGNAIGSAGGSGGGGGTNDGANATRTGGAGNAGSYSPVEGFAGGAAVNSRGSGGGGGAGAVGANAPSTNNGGNGGVGSSAYSSWGVTTGTGQLSGGISYFAGGGGGSGLSANGTGGLGGGATGNNNGTANTGGGAGGFNDVNGMSGGSGIVIVRYLVA